MSQQQICVVVIEVTGLTTPELINIRPLLEHVCQLLQYIIFLFTQKFTGDRECSKFHKDIHINIPPK